MESVDKLREELLAAVEAAGDLDALEQMVQIVQDETGFAAEAYVYEGAPHAFFNDERADAYRPDAAADAWQRTLAWFNTYLG